MAGGEDGQSQEQGWDRTNWVGHLRVLDSILRKMVKKVSGGF